MIENKKIIFESGRILNSKMLNELQNFSLRNIEIKYNKYSSGIIMGFDFQSDRESLYLMPGILKYDEEYYFLNSKLKVMDFSEEGGKKYIYLLPKDKEEEDNIIAKELKIKVSSEEIEKNAIYLGEFQHYQNRNIKTNYRTLENLGEPGVFINIINRKYAGINGETLSPEIISLFANKIIDEIFSNNLDYYIFTKGLNREIVEIDILKKYLGDTDDFVELYKLLKNKEFEKKSETKIVEENEDEGFSAGF